MRGVEEVQESLIFGTLDCSIIIPIIYIIKIEVVVCYLLYLH